MHGLSYTLSTFMPYYFWFLNHFLPTPIFQAQKMVFTCHTGHALLLCPWPQLFLRTPTLLSSIPCSLLGSPSPRNLSLQSLQMCTISLVLEELWIFIYSKTTVLYLLSVLWIVSFFFFQVLIGTPSRGPLWALWFSLHLVTLGSWSPWAKSIPVGIQELLSQHAD